MAEDADQDSKTEEASPRKLQEARKKGDFARSPDIAQTMALAVAAAVLLLGGSYFSQQIASDLVPFLSQPHAMLGGLDAGAGVEIGMMALGAVAPFLLALMLAVIVGSVVGNVAQSQGFIFTAEKIKPKLSTLNPISGFKRIFGPDGLVQFLKTFIKLLAIGAVCFWVLKPHVRELENLAAMSPMAILPFATELAVKLFVAALVFLGLTAGADYIWQRIRFARRMRMTKQEAKDDFKQSEGDPHVKAKLRQIRMQRSRQRMMQAVPTATVVVTNPTHYSVALRYNPDDGDPAPVCVAKGVDALALRIREIAKEHDVPIVENVPLARGLYATVEVDDIIPREHFEAAAKVIGFVMQQRKR
ncbi:flagellar biosynthesis protein FlhB [uncultured Brevundimonas sp.]|uniref:flagellar biosynthesis protein FlhB n=1 Tax=uncultured Brevundimonas sp. TaxID=213418 RepID=UPI00260600C8|nr:flagellar biosynthesis protein FlhB [uncultured Brevundimonas sp.]